LALATYRRRSRARSILIVAVLAAVTLIVLDSRSGGGPIGSLRSGLNTAFSPLQQATHDALAPVGNFLTGAADYGSLRSENQRLRNQVASMQSQAVAAAAAENAADQVLAQQHLPFVGQIPTVTAAVINQGAANFENTVQIDKGSAEGIAMGQAVVAPGGLVGQISQVSGHRATVDLLTDPNFVVGINLGDGVVGSAAGSGRDAPLRVTFDEPPVTTPGGPPFKLTPGQPLATSGQALETIPAGIPVATVKGFSTSTGSPEPTVTLTPIVDLGSLSYVTIELGSGA
jgi:rod shape-determining protein MreC